MKYLRSFYDYIDRETRCSEAGIRIRDWCVRAFPQVLRIAGIFHLCENDGPSESLISEREMDMVVRFTLVAYEHVKASVLFATDREAKLCILKIAEWCCAGNRATRIAKRMLLRQQPYMEDQGLST